MRQKAQTEHALCRKNIVNYADIVFSCMLTKKKFIGKGPRYIYVFKDRICIGKTPFVEVPERQLIINDESRISWTYQGSQITSIQFHIGRESYQYYGTDSVLRDLKKHVGLRIFQTKIQDEYRADSVLGRGSYATSSQWGFRQFKLFYEGKEQCAIFYSECDYKGTSFEFCSKSPNFAKDNVPPVIRSIKIPPQGRITLYEDLDYNGKKVVLTTDQPCITGWQFSFLQSAHIEVPEWLDVPSMGQIE